MLVDPRTFVHRAGGVSSNRVQSLMFYALSVRLPGGGGGANTSLLSFTPFCSPYHRPLVSGLQAHVCPQDKKSARCCRFESHNDSEFIARNSAFYRPKLALIGELHITWPIRHFRCRISRPVVHTFLTLTMLYIFHTYHSSSRHPSVSSTVTTTS